MNLLKKLSLWNMKRKITKLVLCLEDFLITLEEAYGDGTEIKNPDLKAGIEGMISEVKECIRKNNPFYCAYLGKYLLPRKLIAETANGNK